MVNKHRCPCCSEKFSFWSYFKQDNFKDSKKDNEHIKCDKCNNIILLSHRKRTISNIGVLVIFVVSMYLYIEGKLNILWVIGLLGFILLTSYLSYLHEEPICFHDIDLISTKEDNMSGVIFAVIILSSSVVIFWLIFSFAIDMQKSKQKLYKEQKVRVIKTKGTKDGNV